MLSRSLRFECRWWLQSVRILVAAAFLGTEVNVRKVSSRLPVLWNLWRSVVWNGREHAMGCGHTTSELTFSVSSATGPSMHDSNANHFIHFLLVLIICCVFLATYCIPATDVKASSAVGPWFTTVYIRRFECLSVLKLSSNSFFPLPLTKTHYELLKRRGNGSYGYAVQKPMTCR
jgi:hypothetical protein